DGVRTQDEADLRLTGPGPQIVAEDGMLDAVSVGGVTHLVVGYEAGDPGYITDGAVLMVPLPGW
ncbi:MAG: hypothetical protein GXP62_07530, partial [Oligoflexia bacterium]|nr:hypothetical protein [Oligoflexia bacterium]